jgi:hypothetical protein
MAENKTPGFDFSILAASATSSNLPASGDQSSTIEIVEEHESTIMDPFEVTLSEEETAHKSTIQALRDLRDFCFACAPRLKKLNEEIAALMEEKNTIESRLQLLNKTADEAVDRSITMLHTVLTSAKTEDKA